VTAAWTPERLEQFAGELLESPHIAALSEGPFGTAAAYLPGRRIRGIRVRPDGKLEVHVVMAWGSSVDDVEAAVVRVFGDIQNLADLFVDDVAMPETPRGTALPASSA